MLPKSHRWRGVGVTKGDFILAELTRPVQPVLNLRQSGCDRLRRGRLRRPFGGNRYTRRHTGDDVCIETLAGGAPFVDRQRVELAPLRDQLADQRAYDFVRAAEWHSAANQVVRNIGRKEQ